MDRPFEYGKGGIKGLINDSLRYSLCQKKRTFNSKFFMAIPGEGAKKNMFHF